MQLCSNTPKSDTLIWIRGLPVTLPSSTTSSQQWNAAAYADSAHFVPALGQPVLDLLKPQSSERILDLGCGDLPQFP